MGARKRRVADRAGRPAMRSPGRPPVGRREHRERVWLAIAEGMSGEVAGVAAGVSPAVGNAGSVKVVACQRFCLAPLPGRDLSFAEREEIAILRVQDAGVREIARRLGRSPSTISRELRATPRPVAGAWSIGPWPPRGTPTDVPSVRRSPSSPRTSGCGAMCRNAGGRDRAARRHIGAGSGREVDRSPAWAPQGSPVGTLVEPGADLEPAPGRLPG